MFFILISFIKLNLTKFCFRCSFALPTIIPQIDKICFYFVSVDPRAGNFIFLYFVYKHTHSHPLLHTFRHINTYSIKKQTIKKNKNNKTLKKIRKEK